MSPNRGAPGTTVTISGSGFNTSATGNVVFFGATRAVVLTASSGSLTTIVPNGATFGSVTVLNTASGLTAYSNVQFLPTFSPSSGSLNTTDFDEPVNYDTSNGPTSVAIADLDGDGKPDIAVSASINNVVSVLLNVGTGGSINFANKVNFAVGTTPEYITIGDIDGDGKPDIVVANMTSNTITVLRNTSSPGNLSFVRTTLTAGQLPQYIAIGDFDGDGKPDLAVVEANENQLSIFKNTSTVGNVSFASRTDYATNVIPVSVVAGDIDGDGKPDIAVANYDGTLSVFQNTSSVGNISFTPKIRFVIKAGVRSLVMADIDGDNKVDLSIANFYNNSISVLRNTSSPGTISFAASADFTISSGAYSIAAGDLDGDGKPDLATANWLPASAAERVSVIHNISSAGSPGFGPNLTFTSGRGAFSIALGDLNGDGRPDMVVANNSDEDVSILLNDPHPVSTMQATNVTFSNISATAATVQWANGTGSARAVFIKATNTGEPLPVNGTSYTPNTTFGAGSEIGTTGWYNIYNGTANTVNISGLAAGTSYQVMVNEYTGAAGSESYLVTNATGNPASFTTLSNNATLINLQLNNGVLSPSFTSLTGNYVANVGNATTSITITPTASNSAATIMVNNVPVISGTSSTPIALSLGDNTITVKVTAQDGTVKIYSVVVTRAASANADLISLVLSTGTLTPAFTSSAVNYTTMVPNNVSSLTVTPSVSDPVSTIKVNGIRVLSGTASGAIPLIVGSNIITTTVTAQDGTIKTYTILVNRMASSNAELLALNTSNGTLTPSFAPDVNTYNIDVSGDVNYINLLPVAEDPAAMIEINGENVVSGNASQNISLQTGTNVIVTKVTAADGTIDNYTITVTKDKRAQIITFGPLPQKTICSGDFEAGVTSTNSTNPILYTSSDNTVATISSRGIIHVLAAGKTIITADQNANNDFTAADQVVEQLIVTSPVAPEVSIAPDHSTVCAGASVTFTATVANVTTGLSYQWQVNGINAGNNSANFTTVPASSSDVFTCVVTNNSSCDATGTSNSYSGLLVEPVTAPSVTITTASSFPVLPGTMITFTATAGNESYQWQVNGINVGAISNVFSSNSLKNDDVVICIASNNTTCATPSISNEIIVSVLTNLSAGINNSFTPNGDGINDTWTIDGLDAYPNFNLKVFNRNGSLVHQAKSSYTPWDGTLGGKQLPVGTYYYVIDLGTRDKVISGYVTIVR